ncbi:Alstrom syndrome protein 1 [Dromiciops gliroides]|uniref:Alstrom syndrome protein 1 n=1 Tax=Dromiciops gliroides TaxID=33562 RepID=UPI001CC68CE8|nr:Alstrom syndrome protein 1 [Dromiciops gliroides]
MPIRAPYRYPAVGGILPPSFGLWGIEICQAPPFIYWLLGWRGSSASRGRFHFWSPRPGRCDVNAQIWTQDVVQGVPIRKARWQCTRFLLAPVVPEDHKRAPPALHRSGGALLLRALRSPATREPAQTGPKPSSRQGRGARAGAQCACAGSQRSRSPWGWVRETQTWSRRPRAWAWERESGLRGRRRRRRSGSRGMESWHPLNVEMDNCHSLLASSARLNTRREESDLSEFPSVEEGMLTISEEDGRDHPGEASCSPLLAIQDRSGSPHIPLLASSPTQKVWNESLFQQSELEFAPLRGIPDLSEVSESHSRQSQGNEALFPSSSEGPFDFFDRSLSLCPSKTGGISTSTSYNASGMCPRIPRQQMHVYTDKKATSSPDTCDELSRSYGTDSVETLASAVSLRRWETSQKPGTFPARQGQSVLADDGVSPSDCKFSHSVLLPCLDKNRPGFSSSTDSSFCENFNYKNPGEYKMNPKLECLKSDDSRVKRLGDVCSPFKGELSPKFTSHSLLPVSSQGQSMQNPLGPDVKSVKLSVHNDSTRTGPCGVAFPSGCKRSVKFKLDDMLKAGLKEGHDETVAFHEVVASIEPMTSKKSSAAAAPNLLGVGLDWKQNISPSSSPPEESPPGQPAQPIYQSTPFVFPVQNFTPEASLKSLPVSSKIEPSFVFPNEELANPYPKNLVWKSLLPSDNQDVSCRPSEKPETTSGDLPYVSSLTHTYSPTSVNILHHDISYNYTSQGEASLTKAFKENVLRTNPPVKDDTNIRGPQLSENSIISSGRVAEMLREEKYNMNNLAETRDPLQNSLDPSGGSQFHPSFTDQFRDGGSEHSIPPLSSSQAKSDKSTSTVDNTPAPAELMLLDAEVKEYQDRTSQTPPEKKVHHHHCFINPHAYVPSIPCVPVPVIEPQLLCPNTLRIFYKSPKITSNVRSNFNSGISHVSWSVPVESHSHRSLPAPIETSQHRDSQEKMVSQLESTSRHWEEQASASAPETSSKCEQAEEKSVSPALPLDTRYPKEDFKIISERVQRLIDHWDSHLLESSAHATPLPSPTRMSVDKGGKKGTLTLSDIRGTPISVDKDGKKGKSTLSDLRGTPISVDKDGKKGKSTLSDLRGTPMSVDKDGKKGKSTLSDIRGTSEGESKTDKRLHTLLVEAENIARKRFSNSPSLYPDVISPRINRLNNSREAPVTKDSFGFSQRSTRVENVTPATKVETSMINHFTSQRGTGKTQEMESKARVALKETLRQYETARTVSRCEPGRSSAFIGDDISVPVIPFISSTSSSDSSNMRVSYIWDPVSDSFFGYLPNIPTHVYMGDIREREIISDSDDGSSSDDSLAVHVQHLLKCDSPGSFATQMLRNAEEEECRVRARAWNLKFNLATECGDFTTELDEADMRKVEEIKAGLFGRGRPLDVFQDFPCPVGVRNISETLCDHIFIEAHEKGCFRTMANEPFGSPSRGFISNESADMSQRQLPSSWRAVCGSQAESTVQTSQSKAWSFSRLESHQPFPSSTSELHYVSRGTPGSFHEEMETQLAGSVAPASISSQEPISLPSRPSSGFSSDASVVAQADQGQSPPPVQRSSVQMSKSPLPLSRKTLVSVLKKDPARAGKHHRRVSIDLSVVMKSVQEEEPAATPPIETAAEPQCSIKEGRPSDRQDLARGLSPKSLGVNEEGVNAVAEFPSGISPEEQAKDYQPRNIPPEDNEVGPGQSSGTPLSQRQGKTMGKEDLLKQKRPSSNVASVESESNVTVCPNSPAPGGEVSPASSSSSSPKQRAVSYLRITLSPKASNAKLNVLDSGTGTRLNESLSVNTCATESRSLVPSEPAPRPHHKNSQSSKSFSKQTQVNISDLGAYSHSKGAQNTPNRRMSDDFSTAASATSLKLSSDAITQITTEGSEKATFSSEIFINSQAPNILNKPSHGLTAQLSLLPYKPSGSAQVYYVPNSAEPAQYPVAKSETTLESTHSGSNDAIAPDFPPDVLGTRDENVSDIVTIKHREGIYSKKTVCKSAWTEAQNPPPENASESKNQLELENTTHSVFKSAQFYFHHPVHHPHDHDFFCCEPWGRVTCPAPSRRDFFPYADKDPCFPPCEDECRFSPLQTEMDYTRIESYCWNVAGGREPGARQRPEENLQVGSKRSSAKETARIRFSLAQTLEPSATLNELWNRFQERQKQQKPPGSRSSDELSLVDRLDRLAKVLQKPMMLSLQASESAQDDCRGESTQQQKRRRHRLKKDEIESPSSHKSRSPPRSPFGLLGGDPVSLARPKQAGLDSVSVISSDSRPSPEPADPVLESDVTTQTDGEAGLLGEVSSDVSIIGPARIVQGRKRESPKQQQKHLSESRKVAKWKKSLPPSSQVRRKGTQVDSVISSDSFSTVSSAWGPSPTLRNKQNVRMLNKGVQTGEVETVRSTRKHTRDFGVTFPSPNYNATHTRGDNSVNPSSPGSSSEEKKPLTIYLWSKKPRRSKPPCCEENLRCSSKKENQASALSGPGPSWFASLTHTKPWRQPLREKNCQTDGQGSGRLQAVPPVLGDDDREAQRRFVKLSLQESLERLRPDFISRSGARVKRLRLIKEERKLQCLLQRERDELFNTAEQQRESQDIASFLSKKGYVTMRNRTITKKEMVQRSKRIYEQLPEVRKRREEEQRKSTYTTYRYKAQLYKMKITNRVLGRKVPWD